VIPGTTGPKITQNDFIINGPPNSLLTVKPLELVPREERYGTYIKLKYEPTSWLRLYEEFSYQRNEEVNVDYASQPTQADPVTIPANNPFNPFGIPLFPIGQTLWEVGVQTQDAVIKTYRTVTGATLFLPKNWIIDLSFLYAESNGTAYNGLGPEPVACNLWRRNDTTIIATLVRLRNRSSPYYTSHLMT
jgi:hypothetical protein